MLRGLGFGGSGFRVECLGGYIKGYMSYSLSS